MQEAGPGADHGGGHRAVRLQLRRGLDGVRADGALLQGEQTAHTAALSNTSLYLQRGDNLQGINWAGARTACQGDSGDLASIASAMENAGRYYLNK